MTRSIDAVATSAQIKATYRRYLQSLLAVRDPLLDAALRRAIDTTSLLDKGPYLEATPPYAPGATAHELIDEGVLASGFARLASNAMPMDRPLYVHQERAIRKVAAGRNVVVATGTGSGKTESFLLPILDRLVREDTEGTLGPGVRALLLYPMNALANDQLKRLRQLLATYPAITFGRYTGDTEHDPVKARERFGELNIGEPILPNELLSRTEMRATPPHLLLTNYAMLEYLLLRPSDLQLFGSGGTSNMALRRCRRSARLRRHAGRRDRDASAPRSRPSRSGFRPSMHCDIRDRRRRFRAVSSDQVRVQPVRPTI